LSGKKLRLKRSIGMKKAKEGQGLRVKEKSLPWVIRREGVLKGTIGRVEKPERLTRENGEKEKK